MARIHFIVNPLRPSIGLRWPYEEVSIRTLISDFEVHITRGRLHAEILARKALEEGAQLIVCVGGDSTLNQIINGVYRASLGGDLLPKITVHPELQKGDAIKSLQVRKSFKEFLEAYAKGEAIEEKLDLGEVTYTGDYGQKVRRLFLNSAGFGFSSSIVQRFSYDFKAGRSKWQFIKTMIRRLPFYRFPEVDISVDGKKLFEKVDILTGLIQNGLYGGHGLLVAPNAHLQDGHLNYAIIEKTLTYRYFLGILPLLSTGLKPSRYVKCGNFKHLDVTPTAGPRKIRIDFDGDSWGFLPAQFRIREKAITVLR